MTVPQGVFGVFYGISIVLALLNCFYGHKLLKFWCIFVSFCIGAVTAFSISLPKTGSTPISTLIAVFAGLIMVGVVLKTYQIGVFLLCGGLTYLIVTLLFSAFPTPIPEIAVTILGILIGILVGILAVKSAHLVVILITGISGGLSAGYSLDLLFRLENSVLSAAVGIVLAAAGIWIQMRNLKKTKEEL